MRSPYIFTLLRSLTIAIVALILLVLLHIDAPLAQTAAPAAAAPPSLTPSATALLSYAGFGQYAAGIASLIALVGFILAHAIAIMPAAWVPAAGATGFWPTIYTILNWIAGNYGKALNASAVKALLPFGLLVGIGLAVAACSPGQQATAIAATGTALTAADQAALKYVTLPLCPAGNTMMPDGTLCSQPAISAQIKLASAAAYAAYKAAEADPTSATAATAAGALAALTALLPAAATAN